MEPTQAESMAVWLARELRDGELVVGGGVRSAVPMAAAFLAQRLHAPNLDLLLGMGVLNPRPVRLFPASGDAAYADGCEAFLGLDEIFELTEQGAFDVAFYGGLQIDARGNTNLTWVGVGERRMRGPGVANAALSLTANRILLYSERHSPRVFVETVDYVTIRGYAADGSRPLGIPGGPELCVTPLGLFDFPAPARTMSARALASGVGRADVEAATGFEVGWPEQVAAATPPTAEELALVRELDPDGLLRG